MTTTEDVLRRVAAGELTPEQALPLLDAAGAGPASDQAPDAPPAGTDREPAPKDVWAWATATAGTGSGSGTAGASPSGPTSPGPTSPGPAPSAPAWGSPPDPVTVQPPVAGVTGVRVNVSYRSIDLVADPSVAHAVVSGTHSVRYEDGVLVVESQENPLTALTGAARGNGPGGASFSFADLPRSLAWARSWMDQRLVVRVNPELPVELDTTGANVTVRGLSGGTRVRAVASALKLDRVTGTVDLEVMSSSVKGTVVPTGTSRISCESGSVKLLLGAGSDLRIRARQRMGKVTLPNGVGGGGLLEGLMEGRVDHEAAEATVGSGRHELVVESVMSSVVLTDDSTGGMA